MVDKPHLSDLKHSKDAYNILGRPSSITRLVGKAKRIKSMVATGIREVSAEEIDCFQH